MDISENLLSPACTVREALRVIDRHGVPIGLVHEDGVLLGTVTDGDIRRALIADVALESPVAAIMNRRPTTISSTTSDAEALRKMRRLWLAFLPVVDPAGKLLGLKTMHDLSPAAVPNPVVIMAGGLGLRLRPETDTHPKPMLNVNGTPILETTIRRLVAQGFTDITIAVNYRREMIIDHFGDGGRFGAQITYLHEDEQRGTAGALALLRQRPKISMIVMNGDLVTDVNFGHLIDFHYEQKALATIVAAEQREQLRFGVLTVEGTKLVGIEEKPTRRFFINAGIYVISPRLLDFVPARGVFDMPDLFRQLQDGAAAVFPLREAWRDIGLPADLAAVRAS